VVLEPSHPTELAEVSLATPVVPGTATATPLFLWSTNTHFKYRIQHEFGGGKHYVWCSPTFESAALPRYATGAGQPASSDPATIYRQLHTAVKTKDPGNEKITSQKKILRALALKWCREASISTNDRDEIVAMLRRSEMVDWRPLIYVIPYAVVTERAKLVPRARRTSHDPEFIVQDLCEGEFQIIEPYPCP
jgi:hypothetical protein